MIKETEFDNLIFHYHTSLVSNLKKLKYSGKIPSLRELHIELFKKGFSAAAMALYILPIPHLESRDDASMDGLLDNSENAVDLKKALYRSDSYVKNLESLFIFLDRRGLLDI